MKKGFAQILILGLVAAILVLGGAFYLNQIQKPPGVSNLKTTSNKTAQKQSSSSAQNVDTANWKTYTNLSPAFSFKYPQTWNIQSSHPWGDQSNRIIRVEGSDGYIEVEWGKSFGGACPSSSTLSQKTISLVNSQIVACDNSNFAGGGELWSQMYKSIDTNTALEIRANAKVPIIKTRNTILKILSTFNNPDQTTNWEGYMNVQYGYNLKIPSNWVSTDCNGNGQTINFDIRSIDCKRARPDYGRVVISTLSGNQVDKLVADRISLNLTKNPNVNVGGINAIDFEGKPNVADLEPFPMIRDLIFSHNSNTYLIQMTTIDNFDMENKLFDQIVTTFKFTN